MTDEEIQLILNCIAYDRNLAGFQGQTVEDWANSTSKNIDQSAWANHDDWNGAPGGMSKTEIEAIAATIEQNPGVFGNMMITDVGQRNIPADPVAGSGVTNANMFTVTDGSTVTIVYEGTADTADWRSSDVDLTDPSVANPAEQEALQYAANASRRSVDARHVKR